MIVNTYYHLLRRVEYPNEGGYRMEPERLPYWMHITITEENDSKYLTVHSKIHVNKKVVMPPSYSASFTDNEILKDLSGEVFRRFIK